MVFSNRLNGYQTHTNGGSTTELLMSRRSGCNLLNVSLGINLLVIVYLFFATVAPGSNVLPLKCPVVPFAGRPGRLQSDPAASADSSVVVAEPPPPAAGKDAHADDERQHKLDAAVAFNAALEDTRDANNNKPPRDDDDDDAPPAAIAAQQQHDDKNPPKLAEPDPTDIKYVGKHADPKDADENEAADVAAAADAAADENVAEAAGVPAPKDADSVVVGWESEQSASALSATEQKIHQLIDCVDRDNQPEAVQRSGHWIRKNYVRGEHGRFRCFESITYTTHADYTFLDNLQPLLERWKAPISIALFAPGTDMQPTLDSIRHVRDCGPHAQLVRQYATFHLYFPNEHLPATIPPADDLLRTPFNCSLPAPHLNVDPAAMYKNQHKLFYPVNVGRNTARDAAMTHFVFASDIELYPSPRLPEQFLDMIARNEDPALLSAKPHLWPIVLFEVESDQLVPANKTELQRMLRTGKAIPFHKRVCANCHAVPRMAEWMVANETEKLGVFEVGKRHGQFYHWEPIFIGTHADPHYDERLSWEGRSDKMTQGYSLCALDYDFQILDNVFLVHRPGIKEYHLKDDPEGAALAAKTVRLIKQTIHKELKLMYGYTKGCSI